MAEPVGGLDDKDAIGMCNRSSSPRICLASRQTGIEEEYCKAP